MNRSRWSVVAIALIPIALFVSPLWSQAPRPATRAAEQPAAEKWLLDRSLMVTAPAAPVPALKYRLFPLSSELKDGNAVPIYLRLVHEQNDEHRKYWMETPRPWNELPIERIPLADAHQFLDRMKRFYQQLDLGARRKTAEWNYTLDQGSVIDIVLPDMQWMRSYIPMQVLRVRVQLAEANFGAAARSLETGFAFSRQLTEGPFLISALVGVGCASQFTDCALDFIERPGAPNLYWSLTALPRPLIDMRKGMEFEQRFLEMQFPELTELDRPRTPDQWDALLKRIRTEVKRIADADVEGPKKTSSASTSPNEPAAKSPDLPAARKYLADRQGLSTAAVEALPPAQVLILHIVGIHEDLRDDVFKATYLPYPEARTMLAAADERLKATPDTEATRLARLVLPAIQKVKAAEVRLERKIAALRVIEALRMHAAANGGQLPESLAKVTVVPVPDDPGTGKPFEYRQEGPTATLIGRIPGEPLATTGLRYTVTVRGK